MEAWIEQHYYTLLGLEAVLRQAAYIWFSVAFYLLWRSQRRKG